MHLGRAQPMDEGGFFREEEAPRKRADSDSLLLPVTEVCAYCGSAPVLDEIKKCFGILVCGRCNRTKIKLITKTKCREYYLLTEEEMRQFRCMSRPNPHRGGWNDMQLYVEEEICAYSLRKHGGDEELHERRKERGEKGKKTKLTRMKRQIKEMKRQVFLKPRKEAHRHVFKQQGNKGVCECGMEVEQEEI